MPDEEKTPEQIPWAERTKVSHLSDISVWFEQTWQNRGRQAKNTAEVFNKNFEWSVTLDSRADIEGYMHLDQGLTKDLLEFWDEDREKHFTSSFQDRILRWLRGSGQGFRTVRPGPKEWRPKGNRRGRVGQLSDIYGYGNTYNEDPAFWWGDMFEFAHVLIGEDNEEGAVILWNTSGGPMGSYSSPEVWIGNFEDFMSLQSEFDPWSDETFLRWNKNFENGFMWAIERLGYFEDWDEHVVRPGDRHVRGVLEAIETDPSILLPESVEKILENFEDFPKEIQKAVRWLMTNKRRELERALGQKLLWEDVYGE